MMSKCYCILLQIGMHICIFVQVQILLPNVSKLFFYFQTNITQHQHKSIKFTVHSLKVSQQMSAR